MKKIKINWIKSMKEYWLTVKLYSVTAIISFILMLAFAYINFIEFAYYACLTTISSLFSLGISSAIAFYKKQKHLFINEIGINNE